MERLSPAMENYLKVIYLVSGFGKKNSIRVQDIASYMKLTKSSVSRAANFLSQKGLLKKGHYTTISFTETGKQQAQFIMEKHSIIQRFLCGVLAINDKLAEEDASNIGNVISLECYKSICEYMEKYVSDAQAYN